MSDGIFCKYYQKWVGTLLLIERNILLFCILPLTKNKINSILQISNKKERSWWIRENKER